MPGTMKNAPIRKSGWGRGHALQSQFSVNLPQRFTGPVKFRGFFFVQGQRQHPLDAVPADDAGDAGKDVAFPVFAPQHGGNSQHTAFVAENGPGDPD